MSFSCITAHICIWCGRQDSNLHGCPPDPKSGASANFATPACVSNYSILSCVGKQIQAERIMNRVFFQQPPAHVVEHRMDREIKFADELLHGRIEVCFVDREARLQRAFHPAHRHILISTFKRIGELCAVDQILRTEGAEVFVHAGIQHFHRLAEADHQSAGRHAFLRIFFPAAARWTLFPG